MSQQTPEETTALLTRLSQKPGVQSTLILSRSTGAIVRASGLLSSSAPTPAPAPSPADPSTADASTPLQAQPQQQPEPDARGIRSAEDVARVVWGFFGHAGDTVTELMGEEDEVRLVRLRTRRNEIVVVPDAKFLLVCVHETPPA